MSDYGIKVSTPGNNALTSGTLTLNTKYAHLKIDTQLATGFQTILLLITNDTPEPTKPPYYTYTVLYQFKHGYTYIPAMEHLFNVSTPPPSTRLYQKYFQDSGVLGAMTADDSVTLYALADKMYVYFVVEKFNDGAGSANLLTGTNVKITSHIFAQDVGI